MTTLVPKPVLPAQPWFMDAEYRKDPLVQPPPPPGQPIQSGKWYGGTSYYHILERRKRYKDKLCAYTRRASLVHVDNPTWRNKVLSALFGVCDPSKMFVDVDRAVRALTTRPIDDQGLARFSNFVNISRGVTYADPEKLLGGRLNEKHGWTCVCGYRGAGSFNLVAPDMRVAFHDTMLTELLCCDRCAGLGTTGEEEEDNVTQEHVLVEEGEMEDKASKKGAAKKEGKERRDSLWRNSGPEDGYFGEDRARWALENPHTSPSSKTPYLGTYLHEETGKPVADIFASVMSVLNTSPSPTGSAATNNSLSSTESSLLIEPDAGGGEDERELQEIVAGPHVPHRLHRWRAVMKAIHHFAQQPKRQFLLSQIVAAAKKEMPEEETLFRPRTLEGYARRAIHDFSALNPGLVSKCFGRQLRFVASEHCPGALKELLDLSDRELVHRFASRRGDNVKKEGKKPEKKKRERKRKHADNKYANSSSPRTNADMFEGVPLFGSYVPEKLNEWRNIMQAVLHILRVKSVFTNRDVTDEYTRCFSQQISESFNGRMRRRLVSLCERSPHLLHRETNYSNVARRYVAHPDLRGVLEEIMRTGHHDLKKYFATGRKKQKLV